MSAAQITPGPSSKPKTGAETPPKINAAELPTADILRLLPPPADAKVALPKAGPPPEGKPIAESKLGDTGVEKAGAVKAVPKEATAVEVPLAVDPTKARTLPKGLETWGVLHPEPLWLCAKIGTGKVSFSLDPHSDEYKVVGALLSTGDKNIELKLRDRGETHGVEILCVSGNKVLATVSLPEIGVERSGESSSFAGAVKPGATAQELPLPRSPSFFSGPLSPNNWGKE